MFYFNLWPFQPRFILFTERLDIFLHYYEDNSKKENKWYLYNKYIDMSHIIWTFIEFFHKVVGSNRLKSLSILSVNTVPCLRSSFMQNIDRWEVKVLNVPIEESSPCSNKQKRSVETMNLFGDNVREEWLKVMKLPLSWPISHQRFFDIGSVKFLVKSVINIPELNRKWVYICLDSRRLFHLSKFLLFL